MKIAVDAAGGDHYPVNPILGAIKALGEKDDLEIILVGPEKVIQSELEKHDYPADRLLVHDAPQIIGMEESPAQAVKNKPQSSITVGLGMHAKGHAEAFISAGNTGALLAASTLILGRLEAVYRPTIATIYPTLSGFRLMVDVGANLDAKPEMLHQFAKMGCIYARNVMGIANPRVGLLNVGEEEEKGTEDLKKTHKLLKDIDSFIGNVEGRDILNGKADVFVCDGYVGNVLLKFGESIPEVLEKLVYKVIKEQNISQEQAGLVGKVLKQAFEPFDYQKVGGIPFLGVNGVSLVGHGGSTPTAMSNMILNAVKIVEAKVNDKIVASLNKPLNVE
ncbi:MAG: phosphate acyltransferase PlsX [Balneolales bacterium]